MTDTTDAPATDTLPTLKASISHVFLWLLGLVGLIAGIITTSSGGVLGPVLFGLGGLGVLLALAVQAVRFR
ncbi:hypothetical protein [Demequina capsici]|uniref:Uncharacterized protein n=1 Tax=Demequina capsici TaxID=3075620 RepID=A0AA96F712_9MICO|nr:hypothetical protein [Demequina sp. OYTSA14]WNM25251.1 hypothetical protein RN606_03630 [Demequina sp. OYTSA14]